MEQNRRRFIKITSLASATFLPVIGTLAQTLKEKNGEVTKALNGFNPDLEFHLIDNNLLNLHFYFINVERKGSFIRAKETDLNAFMIIRLPQMHVSEKGFWDTDWKSSDAAKKFPNAALSGYSYLAFHLWPDKISKEKKVINKTVKRMKFNIGNLLSWNDTGNFELITLLEWFDLKNKNKYEFDFSGYTKEPCDKFKESKRWFKNNAEIDADLSGDYYSKVVSEPVHRNYLKYKSLVKNFLDHNYVGRESENNQFIPITMLEVPQGLCIIPISGRRDNSAKLLKITSKFWENKFAEDGEKKSGTRKYEVWSNSMYYENLVQPAAPGKEATYTISAPGFRAAGIISPDFKCPGSSGDDCASDQNNNILPSLLDKIELTFLTQWAKEPGSWTNGFAPGTDFKQADFDIREVNGLFFTGLGIITHLKYYNLDKRPRGIDLIEYEHVITQGRDVFIKVSRLGYNCKTGQRYKHVIEGKRVIKTVPEGSEPAASFIELKQYCECIDKQVVYDNEAAVPGWSSLFIPLPVAVGDEVLQPVKTNFCDHKRLPHTSLSIVEKKRIPIDCLQGQISEKSVCVLQNLPWFWPVIENRHAEKTSGCDIPLTDYLSCEYTATDHENKNFSASTPFMFIRAKVMEDNLSGVMEELHKNYFSLDCDFYKERRKTYFNNQKVAFTPSLKEEAIPEGVTDIGTIQRIEKENRELSKTKVNILETDFIETYFNVKDLGEARKQNVPVGEIKNVVFPQVLRAQVFIDHIRDLTEQKISSVVQYHEDYLRYKFAAYKNTGTEIVGNGARVILENTRAFRENLEYPANRTYNQLAGALHEAKNRLGNLAVPDILPDTVSLGKLGITAPPAIRQAVTDGRAVLGEVENGIQKIASFNPRELLRGKLSDVCGLDLTAILDELIPAGSTDNQTPVFELTKLINKIGEELSGSAVFMEIKAGIDAVEREMAMLKAKYEEIAAVVNGKEQELANSLRLMAAYIPDANELDHLVKNIFENFRNEVYNFIFTTIPFADINHLINDTTGGVKSMVEQAKDFLEKQKKFLSEELEEKRKDLSSVVKNIQSELTDEVNNWLKKPDFRGLMEIVNEVSGNEEVNLLLGKLIHFYKNFRDKNAVNDFFRDTRYDNLFRTTAESIFDFGGPVYINNKTHEFQREQVSKDVTTPFKVFGDIGISGYLQVQQKIADISVLVAKNIGGNKYQQDVVKALQDRQIIKDLKARFAELDSELKEFKYPWKTPADSMDGWFNLGDYSTQIRAWVSGFDTAFSDAVNKGLPSNVQQALVKIKDNCSRLHGYADILRRIDPYFYYSEQQRLLKNINDIRTRFTEKFEELYRQIESFIRSKTAEFNVLKESFLKEITKLEEARAAMDQTVPATVEAYYKQLDLYNTAKKVFENAKADAVTQIRAEATDIVRNYIEGLPANTEIKKIFNAIGDGTETHPGLIKDIKDKKKEYEHLYVDYLEYVKAEGGKAKQGITDAVERYIDDRAGKLIDAVGAENILAIESKITEARNIYRLLTAIKQQELTYNWNTTKFRDVNLGIVTFKKFSNPDTTLKVDVKATTYFVPGKFPPVVERVALYSENRLTNFGIGFFNCISISFTEISFISGSGIDTHFDVKIKDVQFDGALSFVQAFQSWLKTMGKGLILELHGDHAALGYSLPIPSIKTPGFNIFNLSLNFDLRIYFDKRPLRFGFSLARPDSKFGIAVGIYAGFGFFSVVADPKKGIVEIDCALEAGAWAGISIGPISGEVKLAFGFRYTKNEFGVRLEGYIVAEGRLTVWILEVSARIYLGVVSENSYVEGVCTVTYSVKLGFIKKSFSGSFHKKIAGAKSNNRSEQVKYLNEYNTGLLASFSKKAGKVDEQWIMGVTQALNAVDNEGTEELLETGPVSLENWKKFINTF